MIEKGFPVLVGDANGADKAVQQYLKSRGYDRVEVFCTEGECRNNLGNWTVRVVPASPGKKGFHYYATKDQRMAEEASVGFMIWDGKSIGTLANIFRLVKQHKKVVVYMVPTKEFSTLRDEADWGRVLSRCGKDVRERIKRYADFDEWPSKSARQARLL
ncbi:MAG: hypothetical protein ACE5JS_09785 [Nitrospinota bacterium]